MATTVATAAGTNADSREDDLAQLLVRRMSYQGVSSKPQQPPGSRRLGRPIRSPDLPSMPSSAETVTRSRSWSSSRDQPSCDCVTGSSVTYLTPRMRPRRRS